MKELVKTVEELTPTDLGVHPVWQYANRNGDFQETAVRAIRRTPVRSLTGRLVGVVVGLANGATAWALIGNVDANNARLNLHFLTLSVWRNNRWFTMARYHDIDWVERGPDALATFLGLSVDDVFPIAYDLRPHCSGDQAALVGVIEKKPRERLEPVRNFRE